MHICSHMFNEGGSQEGKRFSAPTPRYGNSAGKKKNWSLFLVLAHPGRLGGESCGEPSWFTDATATVTEHCHCLSNSSNFKLCPMNSNKWLMLIFNFHIIQRSKAVTIGGVDPSTKGSRLAWDPKKGSIDTPQRKSNCHEWLVLDFSHDACTRCWGVLKRIFYTIHIVYLFRRW